MSSRDQSTILFAALEPDAALDELIRSYKQRVHELIGPQLYLDDPPHLTLFLAAFASKQQVIDTHRSLADRLDSFQIDVTGWHVFAADPLTGNNTLVCEIAANDKERLRLVQHEVVQALAPLRDHDATQARFAARWQQLSPARQAQVQAVGFPFIGGDWQPHWTIASIRSADWPRVWQDLERDPPRGRFSWSRLRLYELIDEKPMPLD